MGTSRADSRSFSNATMEDRLLEVATTLTPLSVTILGIFGSRAIRTSTCSKWISQSTHYWQTTPVEETYRFYVATSFFLRLPSCEISIFERNNYWQLGWQVAPTHSALSFQQQFVLKNRFMASQNFGKHIDGFVELIGALEYTPHLVVFNHTKTFPIDLQETVTLSPALVHSAGQQCELYSDPPCSWHRFRESELSAIA